MSRRTRTQGAPVPPRPTKYSYLHKKNARRVIQLQYVTEWTAVVLATWTEQEPEFVEEKFAILWGLTGWFCELQIPETVDDFWTGPSVLERATVPRSRRNGLYRQIAREESTQPSILKGKAQTEVVRPTPADSVGRRGRAPAAREEHHIGRIQRTIAGRGA